MRFVRLATVFGLIFALAAPALAQPPGGGGFGGFGGFGRGGSLAGMIGNNQQLQEELKMDKEQVDKLNSALAKVREDLRDDTAKLRDRNTTAEQRAEITKRVADANNKAVAEVLKPDQVKRLHQIENQQAGLNMYTKDDVIKSLKLTEAQQSKIKTITTDLQNDMRELFQPGRGNPFDPETTKKRENLQKEATENVQKVLTDDQKSLVKDLTGEPFELRFAFGGPGGAGGGFGGFGGFGAPSIPGNIFSTAIQNTLKLTDDQKKELEQIQKEVDEKLAKMLTEDQKKQLKDIQDRPAGGFGGFGGGGGGRPMRNPPKKDD
jgi:Spy/CpxP family protein refolding chaperone